jgi:hypothetical protein
MSKKNYQKEMSDGTRVLDEAGDDAIAGMDLDDSLGGMMTVRDELPSGGHLTHDVPKFGMLPTQEIDKTYAFERGAQFKELSEHTRRGVSPNGTQGPESAAYKTQQAQMDGYQTDTLRIPDAERDYNLLVPLANMAAQAYVKANAVADMGEFTQDTDIAGSLNKKETAGLAKGVAGANFDEGGSVTAASGDMIIARHGLVSASHTLAGALDRIARKKIEGEKADTDAKKQAIHEKIAKVVKVVGYAETAGAMIAGGGAFVDSQLPGAPEAVMGEDTQQETGKHMKDGGEGLEKGAGYVGKAVEFGMELYYHGALEKLDAEISSLNHQIGVVQTDEEYRDIAAAREQFETAQLGYKAVVEKYAAAISDRHKRMAQAGATADKATGAKYNNDSKVGDKMEYATVMLELQSFLATSMDAAGAAQTTTQDVAGVMRGHRNKPWGYLDDAATGNNTPQHEPQGPDLKVVEQMASMTRGWLLAATELKGTIDKAVSSNVKPALDNAGYDGKY